jgi:hypothetical protein
MCEMSNAEMQWLFSQVFSEAVSAVYQWDIMAQLMLWVWQPLS